MTVDIFLFGLAVEVWMVAEARRLGIRFVWSYVMLGALIVISAERPPTDRWEIARALFAQPMRCRAQSLLPDGSRR